MEFLIGWMVQLKIPGDISLDQFVFGSFMYEICEDIENNSVTNGLYIHHVFLCDNLSVHKAIYVAYLIRVHATHVIFEVFSRSLYMPKISLWIYNLQAYVRVGQESEARMGNWISEISYQRCHDWFGYERQVLKYVPTSRCYIIIKLQ